VDLSAYWGTDASSGLSEEDREGEGEEGVGEEEGGEEEGGEEEGGEEEEEEEGGEEEEEGELVGFKGVDMQTGEVYWDDEEAVFGIGEVSGGPGEGAEVVAQQVDGLAKTEEMVRDENADGDDEAAEGGSALGAATEDVAEPLSAQVSAVQAEIAPAQDDTLLAQKKSWLGSLGGLF
jgi:hypothetical protein